MKPLQVDWTKHLQDPARKSDFENALRNNTLIFSRMTEILNEWEKTILTEETSKEQYQSGSWACLQAHRNGNREIIKRLRDLISFI